MGFNSTEWPANTAWSVDGFAIAYCSLHNLMDVTPWPTLFETQDAPYSNKDLWDIMAPEKPDLPYIYEHFEVQVTTHMSLRQPLSDTSLSSNCVHRLPPIAVVAL